jgi:histidine triad (HIT) family protein
VSSDHNCIFCKIIDKKIPSRIIHEDDVSLAFMDINPQAPFHALIVPKKHITDILNMQGSDKEQVGHLFFIAKNIASQNKLDRNGFRLVINNGSGAGQTVFHIHLHLLSGRRFGWPPG